MTPNRLYRPALPWPSCPRLAPRGAWPAALLPLLLLCLLLHCAGAQAAPWPGERRQAPEASNPHYYANNPYHKKGYGLPNCTAYAWGRVSELRGQAPRLNGTGDASYWFGHTQDGYRRGQEPRLGAVACWRFEGSGHVAVVERVEGEHIVISQSHWSARDPGSKSAPFTRRTIRADGSDYLPGFQGYIYACDFDPPRSEADLDQLLRLTAALADGETAGAEGDVNGSGEVDIADAARLVDLLVGD